MRACLALSVILATQHIAPTCCHAEESRAKKVLLIGIDGLRPDALKAAKTPYLDALIKGGAFADNTQILGKRYRRNDTVSGPGWSSILTGVWADKHGVNGNRFRRPNFKSYPHFFRRLKQVRPQAKTASFVSWKPIADHIVSAADISKVFTARDKTAGAHVEAERQLAEAAAEHLKRGDPDAVFVYFGLVDSMGHTKGFHPAVKEYLGAIEVVDRHIGIVLRGMTARASFASEDWLVLVTTDHGGRGTTHSRGQSVPEIRTVFLIASGPSAPRGKIDAPPSIVDVPVTALVHLGVMVDSNWNLDGRAVGVKRQTDHK